MGAIATFQMFPVLFCWAARADFADLNGFHISNNKKEWLRSWLVYGSIVSRTHVILPFLLCHLQHVDFCLGFLVAKWWQWYHALHHPHCPS